MEIAAIAAADFAVEAVPEKLEIKSAVITEADKILRPEVILASNTSSISTNHDLQRSPRVPTASSACIS